ncbi:unnamed protein product [Rhizoctonia solani]|uniref:Peptidyl-prolyl cis-trans isomerase n=1 Tax=Rhizoctonia solani TaxID=456999 RepID=A0A8H3D8N8_9AGAM|nr:unnamed protein product [Rhizoctonia solani]
MSVKFETSMGEFVLELYWDHAPKDGSRKTCKNFYELAKRGYYNGVIFHRIIADFMAQTGDPTGTGRGGTSIYGQKFEDEITSELRFTGAGILAMANSGPNTNGSQFFITLAPTPYLDGKHTIFGRVSHGMRVVQRLGAVATDSQDRSVFFSTRVETILIKHWVDREKRSRSIKRTRSDFHYKMYHTYNARAILRLYQA